jgi:hypothetical protein
MTQALNNLTRSKFFAIETASLRGWEVIAEGEWGIQFVKRRRLRRDFMLLGALLLPAAGLGGVILLWGYLDYLSSLDKFVAVSAQEITDGSYVIKLDRII